MMDGLKKEGLMVSSSDVPLVRAGYANLIFLLLVIGLILINQAFSDFGISQVIKRIVLIGFCLLMFKVYNQSVSKIFVKDGKALVIVGPFSRTEIWFDDILETKVFGIPSSMTLIFKIKKESSPLP